MGKEIMFKGVERKLATNLKVAYRAQGEFNHKPYMEIFQEINMMTLEEQIKFVYISFAVGNKDFAVTEAEFFEEFMENYDVSQLMNFIKVIVEGILGKDIMDKVEENLAKGDETESESGN